MKEQPNSFDQHIKKALEDYQVPFNAEHWEAFSQELDGADSPSDAFDVLIASRLSNIGETGVGADWNSFEAKLSASENLEDQRFDNMVSDQLSNYQAPYNSKHWKIFSDELDEAFSLRRQLYRYKVMEVAVMLLLFLTAFNFFPWDKFERKAALKLQAVPGTKQQSPVKSDAPIATLPNENGEQRAANHEIASANTVALDHTTSKSEQVTTPAGTASQSLGLTGASQKDNLPTGPLPSLEAIAAKTQISAIEFPLQAASTYLVAAQENASTDLNADLPHSLDPDAILSQQTTTNQAGLSALSTLTTGLPDVIRAESAIGLSTKAQEKLDLEALSPKTNLRFGMFTGYNWNVIRTPLDPVFGTESVWIDSTGFSYGVAMALRSGLWEFELGGAYQTKSYRPSVPVQQYGTFDVLVVETFHRIHLDILEIPLTVRRHLLPNKPQWDLYVQGGIAANLIMKPIYEIRRKELFAGPTPSIPVRAEDVSKVNDVTNQSQLNRKEFSIGLLDGGALGNNSFYSLTMGFGVERALTSRWNVFLQPGFYLQIPTTTGFGPNQDRFHHFSLQLGARANIW